MDVTWNMWHGCKKHSEGCRNCYVYRIDSRNEKDASQIKKNASTFNLPVARNRKGEYKYPSGTTFYTCFTSDFFLKEADEWRNEVWRIMRERSDCRFFFITKRIDRFYDCVPEDWQEIFGHVTMAVTCENQDRADHRLPIYLSIPLKERIVICEPLLERINLSDYLKCGINKVVTGGESGLEARACNYEWVLDLRRQCVESGVEFYFKQTGAKFVKDGRLYRVPKPKQGIQARKADINYIQKGNFQDE